MKALFVLALLLAGCGPLCQGDGAGTEGVERIARGTAYGVDYVLAGHPLDGKAAGMASGQWDQASCVEAERMRDLLVAVRDVGMPALIAWAHRVEVISPEWTPPDYESRCKELAP